jgi:hypothetical protein
MLTVGTNEVGASQQFPASPSDKLADAAMLLTGLTVGATFDCHVSCN